MKNNTTLIIVRVIAISILLYAIVDIIFFALWIGGNPKGHFNLGFPLTAAIGVGLWFLMDWARKFEIFLSLAAIAVGLVRALVPKNILNDISLYYARVSVDFREWQLILVSAILAVEVVFLILPTTVRLFKPEKAKQAPKFEQGQE